MFKIEENDDIEEELKEESVSGASNEEEFIVNQKQELKLEYLTIYYNNVTDLGAIELANVIKGNRHIKELNLQMNYIKDKGANEFLEGFKENKYGDIRRIILLDNQITQSFKKKAKIYESIIV